MLKAKLCKSVAVIGAALIIGSGLGGCGGGGGVDRAELRTMPADVAWRTMKAKSENAEIGGTIINVFSREAGALASAYAQALEQDEAEAERRANNASTPREALETMVADVSAFLKESLPRDARNRGLDQYRLNIAMGNLKNRDEDPTLRGALGLITRNLERDDDFLDQFGFISFDQADADELLIIVGGGSGNLWDPTGQSGGGQSASYRPDTVYVVSGESWIERNRNDYELSVWTDIQATHVQSRRRAGGDTFQRTYYYHPGFGNYITREKNEELRRSWEAAQASRTSNTD